jgi:glutathione S-transferase
MPLPPKLTLYTSKTSVYGQRVNILLHHLQVPFAEVLIPLDRPRELWYLTINPRGLVPALEIEDIASGKKEVVTESALICHFLLDLAPSWSEEFAARADEILPQGHDFVTAARRYRQSLFLDTYFTKLRAAGRSLLHQRTEEAQQTFVTAAKELDPVCPQPGHYFGDSETIGLVEVLTGPYLMRVDANMRWGLMPYASRISDRLQVEAPNFYAWMKMLAADEGIKAGTWDEEVQYKYINENFVKAGIQVLK